MVYAFLSSGLSVLGSLGAEALVRACCVRAIRWTMMMMIICLSVLPASARVHCLDRTHPSSRYTHKSAIE